MGLKFVYELYLTDQVTADLEAPRWIVFSCIPAGSYLMCLRFLQVAWGYWKTGELPGHDRYHVEGLELETPPPEAARQASPPEAAAR
jgi:C4-dicarboxylate transporter DctQ subunit